MPMREMTLWQGMMHCGVAGWLILAVSVVLLARAIAMFKLSYTRHEATIFLLAAFIPFPIGLVGAVLAFLHPVGDGHTDSFQVIADIVLPLAFGLSMTTFFFVASLVHLWRIRDK